MIDFKEVRVFDTSVPMDDPECIEDSIKDGSFVILPWRLHKQLTGLKKNERKKDKAEAAINKIFEVTRQYPGAIDFYNPNWQGISDYKPANILDRNDSDDEIMATALSLCKDSRFKDREIVLYTHDTGMVLKAERLRFNARPALEVREWQFVDIKNKNMVDVFVDIALLKKKRLFKIPISECNFEDRLFQNEGVFIKTNDGVIHKVGIVRGDDIYLMSEEASLFGVSQKSLSRKHPIYWQQVFAINMLMETQFKYCVISGVAGSGKTLLALASAFEMLDDKKSNIENIYVTRTIVGVGNNDLGALPGQIEEKMGPWVGGIMDNIKELQHINPRQAKKINLWLNGREEENSSGINRGQRINLLPLQHIRGRNIKNSIIILDENQNTPFDETFVLASRLGENSRLIMLGDHSPEQIDTEYLSPRRNGMVQFTDMMREDKVFSYVNLPYSSRSDAVRRLLKRLHQYKNR